MPKKITKTSKNTNCLEGVKCPKCGQEGLFKIAASVIVEVSDDGTEDQGGDYEWDQAAFCQCCDCDHAGKLADFTIENWGNKKPKKRTKQASDLERLHRALMKSHDLFYEAQAGDSGDKEYDADKEYQTALQNLTEALGY